MTVIVVLVCVAVTPALMAVLFRYHRFAANALIVAYGLAAVIAACAGGLAAAAFIRQWYVYDAQMQQAAGEAAHASGFAPYLFAALAALALAVVCGGVAGVLCLPLLPSASWFNRSRDD